jgi:hypothetical protein
MHNTSLSSQNTTILDGTTPRARRDRPVSSAIRRTAQKSSCISTPTSSFHMSCGFSVIPRITRNVRASLAMSRQAGNGPSLSRPSLRKVRQL